MNAWVYRDGRHVGMFRHEDGLHPYFAEHVTIYPESIACALRSGVFNGTGQVLPARAPKRRAFRRAIDRRRRAASIHYVWDITTRVDYRRRNTNFLRG